MTLLLSLLSPLHLELNMAQSWLDELKWNSEGLLPVVAQDASSGRILMQAWINPEALTAAEEEGRAVYWSRSRQKLWRVLVGQIGTLWRMILQIFIHRPKSTQDMIKRVVQRLET